MKKTILVASITLLSACSTMGPNQTQHYALAHANGTPVSMHNNENDCLGAAITKNIRIVNEWNASHNAHDKSSSSYNKPRQVSCSKH